MQLGADKAFKFDGKLQMGVNCIQKAEMVIVSDNMINKVTTSNINNDYDWKTPDTLPATSVKFCAEYDNSVIYVDGGYKLKTEGEVKPPKGGTGKFNNKFEYISSIDIEPQIILEPIYRQCPKNC